MVLIIATLLLSVGPVSGVSDVVTVTRVNVIPMDRERILRDQTVVVRGGRIVSIGDASKVKLPAGAKIVDGRGKFLTPGLMDMHVHMFSDDSLPDELAPDELAVMLANGVTTVRFMIGTPEQLALRDQTKRGEILGPTIFCASPQLTGRAPGGKVDNGYFVTSAAEAREAVRKSKEAGYDFIKLTDFVRTEAYDAATDEAKKLGLRVVGHVDPSVGVLRALAAGQQIEHLDAYLEACLRDDSPIKDSISGLYIFRRANWESLDYIDDAKVKAIAQATARAGVYVTPTLTFWKLTFGIGMTDDEVRSWPDYRFIPPSLKPSWHAAIKRIWTDPPPEARRRRFVEVRNALVREIHSAGGKIMAGSDSPDAFLVYGFSLHRELRSLVEAGLSPYAALESATRIPAEFLGIGQEAGTLRPGMRADLLLLDANPLADISNTQRIAGVMLRGRWMPARELAAKLDEVARRFEALKP